MKNFNDLRNENESSDSTASVGERVSLGIKGTIKILVGLLSAGAAAITVKTAFQIDFADETLLPIAFLCAVGTVVSIRSGIKNIIGSEDSLIEP